MIQISKLARVQTLPQSTAPVRADAEPALPTDGFAPSLQPAKTYSPHTFAAPSIDGRTLSSRVRQEPPSVDRCAHWAKPEDASLWPVDRSGQPWTMSKLAEKGPELVRQGPLGDCYQESPLASALQQDPRLIVSTTRSLGSAKGVDYYGTVFFVPPGQRAAEMFDRAGPDVTRKTADGKTVGYTPVWVVTDGLLPAHADGSLVTGAIEIPEIHENVTLNAIREKALATLHGKAGYRNITNGGDADKMMETISGYPSTKLPVTRSKDPAEDKQLADQQFQALFDAHQNGLLTTISTLGDTRQVRKNFRDYPNPPVKGYQDNYFNADKFVFRDGTGDAASTAGTGQQSGQDSRTGYGWVGCHEYSILDASVDNGVKMVRMRNPWGDVCPPEFADKNAAGKPIQNGCINIPWYLARQLVDVAKIGGRPESEHNQDPELTFPPKQGLPKDFKPTW